MNTTAKGDAFENRVYAAIERALNSKELGLEPTTCKIFQKKPYYSKDRDSDIIVDISIEVYRPNAQEWSILWVCECKDYNRPLSVEEVEEFYSKLKQIAGKNVKGVMAVSHSSLRSAAFNFAKSNGIGVVRVFDTLNKLNWIMEHKLHSLASNFDLDDDDDFFEERLDYNEFVKAIIDSEFKNSRFYYAIGDGRMFTNWRDLLKHSLRELA